MASIATVDKMHYHKVKISTTGLQALQHYFVTNRLDTSFNVAGGGYTTYT